MEDIQHYDIPVYNFPYDVEEDDEETIQENQELRVRPSRVLPSAVPAKRTSLTPYTLSSPFFPSP
jgi:septin family protein